MIYYKYADRLSNMFRGPQVCLEYTFKSILVFSLLFLLNTSLYSNTSEVIVSVNWPSWSSDNRVNVYDPSDNLIQSICNPSTCYNSSSNNSYSASINLGCLANGSGYYLQLYDNYGDGWNGSGTVTVTSGGSTVINSLGMSGSTSGPHSFSVSGGGGSCGSSNTTVSSRVNASSDDAEERVSDGVMESLTSSDLELVDEDGSSSNRQEVGMRFRNMTIPQGASIVSAYVEFETDATNSGTCNLTIYGQDIDDAPTFTSSNSNISNRTKTSANVSWSPSNWSTVSQKHQTSDISSIIQEIVNRGGWSSGNDIVIIITGSGEREAESYDGESANAPLLVVEYNTNAVFSCSSGILSNPEFESGTSSWSTSSNVSTTTDSYFGSTAARASTSSSGGVWQSVAATPGQTYSLEAWAKVSGGVTASLSIRFFDSSWNELGYTWYETVNATSYQAYYLAALAPANTAWVQAVAWKNSGSGTATFDGFCFQNWSPSAPSCSNTSCDIDPSWGNYIFSLDDAGDGSNWLDYHTGGLILCDNGDNTLSIKGNIIGAWDAGWEPQSATVCGSQDGWYLDLTLSDMQTWAEFGGTYAVDAACPTAYQNLDYYDVSGTLSGLGCNAGRTINITGPTAGYRMQIGYGGNQHGCGFGMSTWFAGNEGGTSIQADIYSYLDFACYQSIRPTCDGYITAVTSQTGVTNPTYAEGAPQNDSGTNSPDPYSAQMWDNADQIVLDFGQQIGTNTNYQITWRKSTNTSADPSMRVEESTNNSTWTEATGSPFGFSQTTYFNSSISSSVDARYIRITNLNEYNCDLDGITFSSPCNTVEICSNGLDDDGDGYADNFDTDCPNYAPFICTYQLFQSLKPTGSSNYNLYRVMTSPIGIDSILNLTSSGVTSSNFNALAYNPVDKFLYGIDPASPYTIFRINNLGEVQNVGNVTGYSGDAKAGGMGPNGEYYLTGFTDTDLYEVDINTLTATSIADLQGLNIDDIAVSPIDGLIYGWEKGARQLIKINPSNGSIINIGSPDTRWANFGALYFNEQGEIIAYGNDVNITTSIQETLVKIDPTTGVVSVIGTGPETSNNDGCSCSFGLSITKEIASSTECYGGVMTYTFRFYNQSGIAITNLTFEDELHSGVTWATEPQNVTGITLGSTSITGTSNASFTIANVPIGESSFTIDANIPGNYSGPSTYVNQAFVRNTPTTLSDTIFSDDPNTVAIVDSTEIIISPCAEICGNGFDDDADGFTDNFDTDCPNYAPIVCDDKLYQTREYNGDYWLYEVNTNPVSFTQL